MGQMTFPEKFGEAAEVAKIKLDGSIDQQVESKSRNLLLWLRTA